MNLSSMPNAAFEFLVKSLAFHAVKLPPHKLKI